MRKLLTMLCIVACCAVQAYPAGQPQSGNNSRAGGTKAQSAANDALLNMEKAFSSLDAEFTPEDEYYLGRAVAANILAAYKPYTQDAELTRYLNRICQTIAINSPQPEIFNGYHVIVLDSPEYNAFATPGGHILITKRLIETATSEDMLAAIIAHEFAHIILKHSITIIDDMRFTNEAAALADRAADFAGNSPAAQRLISYRNSVAHIFNTMIKSGYSQPQEFEADTTAITLLAASGYNPEALMEVLRVLQRTQNSQRGGFNATHPNPAARISNAERTTGLYRVQDTGSYRAPRFNRVLAK